MRVFKYLNIQSFPTGEGEVYDNSPGFLTRDEYNRVYVLFADFAEFYAHLMALPGPQRMFNEVIIGPQRMKFDIDGDNTDGDEALCAIIDAISDAFLCTFEREFECNIYTTIALDVDNKYVPCDKFSHHIVTKYYSNNNLLFNDFTKKVQQMIPDKFKKYLDTGVNKSTQNFRILGNCKAYDEYTRVKLHSDNVLFGDYTFDYQQLLDSLITNIEGCSLLTVDNVGVNVGNNVDSNVAGNVANTTTLSTLTAEDTTRVLAAVESAGLLKDHRLRRCCGSKFVFNRVCASFCRWCNHEHTSDNTLLVTAFPDYSKGSITIYANCRKNALAGTTIAVIDTSIIVPTDETKIAKFVDRRIEQAIVGLAAAGTNKQDDPFMRLTTNIYDEPTLRPFEIASTLFVHAGMKMGKTKALVDYINREYKTRIQSKIVIVSFRQTFSANIREKFKDFALYSDIKGPIREMRVICQVESLHRLEVGDAPDLLICDECESIFEQFDSGLLRGNFSKSFAVFKWLMQYSSRCIFMDAMMSTRSYNIVEHLRYRYNQLLDAPVGTAVPTLPNALKAEFTPMHTHPNVVYHRNVCKNATNDKYTLFGDKSAWVDRLIADIRVGKRIAITINSLDAAKTIHKLISDMFPKLAVKLYSSETTMNEKRVHLGDVDNYWSKYDVLIYTPTITAGVSFEAAHFHRVYCYFTDMSCGTNTCIQMIGRIRNVIDREYMVYINATGNNLPTSTVELRNNMYSARCNLFTNTQQPTFEFEYDVNGNIKFYNSDYLLVYLENLRIVNISRNDFISDFIAKVSDTGATFAHSKDLASRETLELLRIARNEVIELTSEEIVNAADIDQQAVDAIQFAIMSQVDVPRSDILSLRKRNLVTFYDYDQPLTTAFVTKYNKPNIRRIYRNLMRVHDAIDLQSVLNDIREEEQTNYMFALSLDEHGQNRDITRLYLYERHRMVISLLTWCGWTHINDNTYKSAESIVESLKKNIVPLRSSARSICTEFSIKYRDPFIVVDLAALHSIIEFINKILREMYDIAIIPNGKDRSIYILNPSSLFTTSDFIKDKPVLRPSVKKPIQQPTNDDIIDDYGVSDILDALSTDTLSANALNAETTNANALSAETTEDTNITNIDAIDLDAFLDQLLV